MSEGVLGGLLGGDEEAANGEAGREALALSDAFAAAVAADHTGHDPDVARAMTQLLQRQVEQIDAETPWRMAQLRGQAREGRLRRLGQRIRLAMQAGVALVFLAVGLSLLMMVADAVTSNVVVVEAFDAPPALTAQGINGKVVASALLDALQKLQTATRSVEKGLIAQTAWASDVQIDVPETGVSLGEINRLLHKHFGHDLHIGGTLLQLSSGSLALTVRGDGMPARRFEGAATALDALTTQAAEYAYGQSQPERFAVYLVGSGRGRDALEFLPGAFARAPTDASRARLANSWGNAFLDLNQPGKAIEKYRLSIALDPNDWHARSNLPLVVQLTDGEEAGWREASAFLKAVAAAPPGRRPDQRLLENAASIAWDLPLFIAAMIDDVRHNSGAGAATNIDGPLIADTEALMHDPDEAARYMAASDPDDPQTKAEALLLAAYTAMDRQDFAAAVPPLEAFWKAWQASPDLQTTDSDSQCYLGLAYGMAHRMTDADALFAKAGPWSRCAGFHGYALALAGDAADAAKVWDVNVRAAPDLPHVYLWRGMAELQHGDLIAAESDFAAAHARAPHYADPLKYWGDALSRQGKWKDAQDRYAEALTYAPGWLALRQARAGAAAKR